MKKKWGKNKTDTDLVAPKILQKYFKWKESERESKSLGIKKQIHIHNLIKKTDNSIKNKKGEHEN